MSISPDDLLYVDVPDCGNCLSGVQAMLYAKWFVGASYVGLRAGILVYQVDGQHERQVKPVKFKGQILYPVKIFMSVSNRNQKAAGTRIPAA